MSEQNIRNLALDKVDKAFTVKSEIEKDDIKWFNIKEKPFNIYGLYKPENEDVFKRMPTEVTQNVNIGVQNRNFNTAGGRVRFKTDSPYLAIKVEYSRLETSSNFSLSGSSGVDIYTYKNGEFKFFDAISPAFTDTNGYERLIELGENAIGYRRSPAETHEKTEYVLTMPTYCSVDNMYIGIKDGSVLESGSEYKIKKPIVYYGPSTTQGGCASRPSLAYPELISRKFNADYVNLGFSGSAHGEETIFNYLADLDMSIFVYDFDYNTDASGLLARHLNGYKIIREKNPNLPIIIMGHPNFRGEKWNYDRMNAIDKTYKYALSQGDKNVAYIRSPELFGELGVDCCTVDGIHPNDLGFYKMYERLSIEIEKFIK